MRAVVPAALACLLFGCATGTPAGGHTRNFVAHYRAFTPPAAPRHVPTTAPKRTAEARPLSDEARRRIVATAREQLGRRQVVVGGRSFPSDCTGLIRAAFSPLGVDLLDEARPGDNAVTAIYRFVQRHGRVYEAGRPMPGDLVFFRETYDLNRDGRHNDGLTHIGVVEDVAKDGTVTVIHRVSRGVVRYRMNLANPDVRKDPSTGQILNDALRNAGPDRREVLTGQLFAGFATLHAPDESLARR